MGIKQLAKLISEHAPKAVSERSPKNYLGRILAVDASMCLYQFLIAIRSNGGIATNVTSQLTNDDGKVTSHISGMFYRTIRLLESGIKPVYVFDGKPPTLKSGELSKRAELKKTAIEDLAAAIEAGDIEKASRLKKRTVRVSKEETEETITLLTLMGIPIVRAPSEAEAQCAEMCKKGVAYGVVTEDMDALTFGTPIQVRNLFRADGKKVMAKEYNLEAVLEGFGVDMEKFVDVCILCGCDYTRTIAGVGPVRALDFVKKFGSIEGVIKGRKKLQVGDDFLFKEAREMFNEPEVNDSTGLKLTWKSPDIESLIDFMVNKNGFKLEKIQNGIKRLTKSKKNSAQTRLENYFGIEPKPKVVLNKKRKVVSKKKIDKIKK